MLTRDITIGISTENLNTTVTYVIKKANEFQSKISVCRDAVRVNAKSLLGLISMGLQKGDQITITAEGADAADALDALAQLLGD